MMMMMFLEVSPVQLRVVECTTFLFGGVDILYSTFVEHTLHTYNFTEPFGFFGMRFGSVGGEESLSLSLVHRDEHGKSLSVSMCSSVV